MLDSRSDLDSRRVWPWFYLLPPETVYSRDIPSRDKSTSISHLKSHVSKDWPLLVLCSFLEERIHQQLTLSSINVLSFFSFENSTHNRLSHSLPSSADDVKGKIQSRISKLFFIDFRFKILTQLCSYLLNIVSHPSNFSDNIAANPSI